MSGSEGPCLEGFSPWPNTEKENEKIRRKRTRIRERANGLKATFKKKGECMPLK
ncbi:hypothetical protein LEP1GSC178_0886 [Leptospira licerasiae str. MMD4847]|uniref:Uncharacterized protein n=1 Tax=Leptospira licerasiae str. MMD4847 TaxID=1049971 RepID=A0ABN0H4K9_9LEPT|nr:hypothetical protein LEP1GSC178_0886 [Leptospira licerasiae str. MMD4847]